MDKETTKKDIENAVKGENDGIKGLLTGVKQKNCAIEMAMNELQ